MQPLLSRMEVSANNVLDFKVLRSLKSLKDSRDRIKALCETIASTDDQMKGINSEIAKGVQIQRAYNAILINSCRRWEGTLVRPMTRPALRIVK